MQARAEVMSMQMTTRTLVSTLALTAVASFFAACGGAQPPAETPAPSETAEPAPAPEEAKPEEAKPEEAKPEEAKPEEAKPAWKDMTHEQRAELMKNEVVPKMGELFKEFDAKEFAEFGCKSCHRPGQKEKFHMPNPALPKLDPAGGFAKHKKKDAKWMAFMSEKVLPKMKEILGEGDFNPETKEGFGCGGCHTFVGH